MKDLDHRGHCSRLDGLKCPAGVVGTLVLALAASCGGTPAASEAELAFSLSKTPPGVKCIAVTVASSKTEHRPFDVGAGTSASPGSGGGLLLTLRRMPVGVVVLSFDAFDVSCPAVVGGVAPTFQSGPLTVTLKPGGNPTLTVVLQASSEATVAVGFDPNAAPVCAAAGSACGGNNDCCSRTCAFDPTQASPVGVCRADEPPAVTDILLAYEPDSLDELGGRASYPAFDGDHLFVSFPGAVNPGGEDGDATAVRRYVAATLSAVGFSNPDRVVVPIRKSAPAPEGPVELPGANYGALVASACDNEGTADKTTGSLCSELIESSNGDSDAAAFIDDAVGMSVNDLRAEISQPLSYWSFSERELGVPIEHKGLIVVRRGPNKVSAVFGSVLDRYHVDNVVNLNPEAALARAIPALERQEREPLKVNPRPGHPPRLVLLPFGTSAAPSPRAQGRPLPALRYAYRIRVNTSSGTPGHGSYTLWVDAATGDLLEAVPESSDASATMRPWCRDPSVAPALNACKFNVTVDDGMSYNYKNGNILALTAFNPGTVPANAPLLTLFPGLAGAQVCPGGMSMGITADATFRAANAFTQLERARGMIQNGGKIPALASISVTIDGPGDQNSANFGSMSLSFMAGGIAVPSCPDPGSSGTLVIPALPGAQDLTILGHELAHLATVQLQTSNPDDNCGPDDCPIMSPYNRRFFHDYADGYAAMIADTPCIGGWAYKTWPGPGIDAVAASCATARGGAGLPRLLFADDNPAEAFVSPAFTQPPSTGSVPPPTPPTLPAERFPDHRELAPGEYGDGQILGAALWHTWQGVRSLGLVAGTIPVWGRVNEAVWSSGFAPTVCPYADPTCDSNIYRSGRELLQHLTDAWLRSDAPQTVNKLLSAFARAGIFMAPASCVTGVLGDPTPPLDPQFCSGGKTAADAIIDVTDNDSDPADSTERFGIRFKDDDYVSPSGPAPSFRVWTGAPFVFDAKGAVIRTMPPAAPLCNDLYQIELLPLDVGQTTWDQNDPTGAFSKLKAPEKCYDTQPLDPTLFQKYVDAFRHLPSFQHRLAIAYRVTTKSSQHAGMERFSTQPGAKMWPPPSPDGFAPSVFFINADGHAGLF